VQAGIFDSLFGSGEKKSDVVVEESEELPPQTEDGIIHEEKVIVEEEVISADEYMDSSEESDEKIFSEESAPQNQPAYEEESAVSDEDIIPEVSFSEEEEDPFIKVKNILLSYVDKPEKIYLLQHFPVKIKAIIPRTNVTAIQTEFIKGRSFRVLNPESAWVKTGDNSYENTFYFKLLDKSAKLPNIKVINQTSDGSVRSEILKAFPAKLILLREDELFSRVVADNLSVENHQERPYDESANLVVMEVNATGGNLEDFHIPFAIREGIDQIKTEGRAQKIYFFAIVPNVKKRFKFKYFNPQKNRYEIVSFDIRPIDTTISTHTELNPQKNKYVLYKVIFLVVMVLLFVALFFIYRKYYLLGIAVVFIVLLTYVQIPITKVTLPAGSPLRILPMPSSTVFFRTEQPMEVDILLKKSNYTKVLLPNQKIGWVKNEDIR
jgi:hypothetical protein